jgi:uncharacterized protein
MTVFVREMRFGDPRRLEIRPAHRDHLRELFEAGKVRSAGPFADDSGGLIVYEVADEDEARRLVADDPYTAAGVVEEVRLTEWTVILPPTG